MSSAPDLTSRVLGHQRLIVAAGVAILAALAWLFVIGGAGVGGAMSMAEPPPFLALVLMWWVMMAAMMLPSAAPAILLYAQVRATRSRDTAIAGTWAFLTGYVAVWLIFSIVAASAQRALTGPAMALDNRIAAAAVLVAAGLYQFSPFKSACLRQCRSPAQFLSRNWRPGVSGALRLGVVHGAQCVGCCWLLMALLFVGGVMNLWWIVALTLLVALEKLVPGGAWIARVAGVTMFGWGLVIAVTPALSRGVPFL